MALLLLLLLLGCPIPGASRITDLPLEEEAAAEEEDSETAVSCRLYSSGTNAGSLRFFFIMSRILKTASVLSAFFVQSERT